MPIPRRQFLWKQKKSWYVDDVPARELEIRDLPGLSLSLELQWRRSLQMLAGENLATTGLLVRCFFIIHSWSDVLDSDSVVGRRNLWTLARAEEITPINWFLHCPQSQLPQPSQKWESCLSWRREIEEKRQGSTSPREKEREGKRNKVKWIL